MVQSCKPLTPSPSVFSGNTEVPDTADYNHLMRRRQMEWSNMCAIDSSNIFISSANGKPYLYDYTIAPYFFIDSLMHKMDYMRESLSDNYITTFIQKYLRGTIYPKFQKDHQIQLLSIQDSPQQLYQDTISQIMKVVIDGDTFVYPAYLVKKPFIDIPPEYQKNATPEWEFKIPLDMDIFWDLYKEEPLVCELLTNSFRPLANSIYRRGDDYIDWLTRMIHYQDSDFARRKLCFFVLEGFSDMQTSHYAWLDSTMIQSIETMPFGEWFQEEKYRIECLETLWEGYEEYQEQHQK